MGFRKTIGEVVLFRILYFAGIIIRETGTFSGRVILLGSFFEKQVIGMEIEKELMVFWTQNGPENSEKVIPGRPKSRPWRSHGSDALSGAFLSVGRR